jgi:MYXO-CTERM domain-containing protein
MRWSIAATVPALALALLPARAWAYGEAVNGFPNWSERVMHEWTNRARSQPSVEMTACGSACSEAACYTPTAPVLWNEKLNHAARFHSDEMAAQAYFDHDSKCNLVSNIDSLYPATCQGAASCACVGGAMTCSGTCTGWATRVGLFGNGTNGEIIAGGTDPNGAFYQWLFESYNKTTCAYDQGPPTNGHRWHLLKTGPSVGFGKGSGASVGDFGAGGTAYKIPSGSHYPRQASSVEAWANWYDTAGPQSALINVDGTCSAMSLQRGAVTNGAYRATLTSVASGCHRYFFLFKDSGGNIVTYPSTGSLGIGPAGSCADWDTSRPTTGAGCDCAPQCTGKECGDDGCGGSCGNCDEASGEMCSVGGTCLRSLDDAGVGGDGSGGSNSGDGGVNGGDPNASGGCGCATGSRTDAALASWLAALVVVLRLRRRRRATGATS